MALNLATKILGGEGANRLQNVLRSEKGLTYGASADMDAYKLTGSIIAETDTQTSTTGEALRLTVDEFWRLVREPVGDRELMGAQAYLAGSFPLSIETADDIALQVLNLLFFDLDVKELETYRDRINAVTSDDIQRVAKQFVKPGRLSIVLVGDARQVLPQLKAVGVDNVEVLPLGRPRPDQPVAAPQGRACRRRRPGADPRMAGVMISCGEPSGDLYAGALATALRRQQPDVDVFGFGGPRLAAAGGRLLGSYEGLAVTGLSEVLRTLPRTWRMYRHLIARGGTSAPGRLRRHRLRRLQFPARTGAAHARHPRRVLHRAATLGLASRAHAGHQALRRSRAGDLSRSSRRCTSGPAFRSSSSAIPSSTSSIDTRRAPPS